MARCAGDVRRRGKLNARRTPSDRSQERGVICRPALLEFARQIPHMRRRIPRGSAPAAGRADSLEAPSGPSPTAWRSRLAEKGFRSMSRMTLLDGNLWLSLAAPRALERRRQVRGRRLSTVQYRAALPNMATRRRFCASRLRSPVSARRARSQHRGRRAVIRGKQSEEQASDYLHRGIAARQFRRSFQLASGVEVQKAELKNGLLAIELQRPRQEKRVLKVGITAAD